MVFGGDGSEMSGVVLDTQHGQSHGLSEHSGAIIGMKIAYDEFGRDIQHSKQPLGGLLIKLDGARCAEISYVLR
jgi:hypothetical protein